MTAYKSDILFFFLAEDMDSNLNTAPSVLDALTRTLLGFIAVSFRQNIFFFFLTVLLLFFFFNVIICSGKKYLR